MNGAVSVCWNGSFEILSSVVSMFFAGGEIALMLKEMPGLFDSFKVIQFSDVS